MCNQVRTLSGAARQVVLNNERMLYFVTARHGHLLQTVPPVARKRSMLNISRFVQYLHDYILGAYLLLQREGEDTGSKKAQTRITQKS